MVEQCQRDILTAMIPITHGPNLAVLDTILADMAQGDFWTHMTTHR